MQIAEGYKQTEVGVIPEGWNEKTLGEVTSLMTNGFVGTAKSHYTDKGGVLYLQGYNILENSFKYKGIKYVTEKFHRAHQKSNLRSGDLLTVQTGDVGLTTVVPPHLEGSNCHALIISRPRRDLVDSKFLSLYLNSYNGRSRLKEIEIGTTMKHLNVGDMLDFLIPLPPTKAEQEAIAEALSDADSLIESLQQLIAKKRQIKQGAMQTLLAPKPDWIEKTLGSLAHSIKRGASPRPIDSPVWFDNKSSIGWVRISDVTKSGRHLTETVQKLSPQGVEKSRPVKSGSLIMSICATVGRPIETTFDVCIHDGFVVFEKPKCDQSFLYHSLRKLEPTWGDKGQTGSQMNLNTDLINNTKIALPSSITEQTRIASILSDMDEEITALETKLSKAQQIKQGMMSELLTGKTRLV